MIQNSLVRQFRNTQWREISESLVVEEPLEIRINGRRYTATMRTPFGEREDLLLAQGLLFTEGVISELDDIETLSYSARCRDLNGDLVNVVDVVLHDPSAVPALLFERSIISNSSCGLCGKASVAALSASVKPVQAVDVVPDFLLSLPAKMRAAQRVFEATGGLHAAAIFSAENGEMRACFEDIGRHNATDRAIGLGLELGFLPAKSPLVLLVSGRASFEIVQKALRAQIGCIAAVSAASNLAVELARANNQSLVGFLRESTMTRYC